MSFTLSFPTIINAEGGTATLTYQDTTDVPQAEGDVTFTMVDGNGHNIPGFTVTAITVPTGDELVFTALITVANPVQDAVLTATHDGEDEAATFSYKTPTVTLTVDGVVADVSGNTDITTDRDTVTVSMTVTDVHDGFDAVSEIFVDELDDAAGTVKLERLLTFTPMAESGGSGVICTFDMTMPHDGVFHIKVWTNKSWHTGAYCSITKATPSLSFLVDDTEVATFTTNNKLVTYSLEVTNLPHRLDIQNTIPTIVSSITEGTTSVVPTWSTDKFTNGTILSDEALEILTATLAIPLEVPLDLTADLTITRKTVNLTIDNVVEDAHGATFFVTPTNQVDADTSAATWTVASTANGSTSTDNTVGSITAVSGSTPEQLTFTITTNTYGENKFSMTSSQTGALITPITDYELYFWPDVTETWDSEYSKRYLSGTQKVSSGTGTTRPIIGHFEAGTIGFRGILVNEAHPTIVYGTLSNAASIKDDSATWFELRKTTTGIPGAFKLEQPVTGIKVDMADVGSIDYMLTRIYHG